mgnify:FL=1
MIDIAAIKARADKATSGPWESDATQNEGDYGSGPDCVSGFSSYEVIAEKGRICDTINSDVAMVCEEYDEDGCTAFDEVGQANMDFIAHARTDIPALLAALEASKSARVKAEQERDALRNFVADFADANIEMLPMPHIKHPADEPDKAVSAAEVWEWQSDARRALEQKS